MLFGMILAFSSHFYHSFHEHQEIEHWLLSASQPIFFLDQLYLVEKVSNAFVSFAEEK